MGRYAFFNTGFEYKFRFACQESSDIRMFAGIMRFPQNRDGDFYHEWDSRDLKAVQELCEENRAYLDIEPIDMETYEKSVEGTQDLRSDLYELYEESYDEEDVARYILGCLIYHQLLYCNPLHVHYET